MIEATNSSSVPVPTRLRNPHRFVEATHRFYENVRPDEDGRMRPWPREGIAHLIVSRQALRRALLYLQAIFTEAERRGWEVAPSRGYEAGVAIVIRGHSYPVSLNELHDRVPMSGEDVVPLAQGEGVAASLGARLAAADAQIGAKRVSEALPLLPQRPQ